MIRSRPAPVYAVILAGGAGTRLWPVARAGRPKQFLALHGKDTLFQQACRRAAAVAPRTRVLVVCGRDHVRWVRRQAPWIPAGQIIVEGTGRNTAASVALAAFWIRRRARDGIMVIMPSDHHIAPISAFRRDVRMAARGAERSGALVMIGVPARNPDTGFGYIEPEGRVTGRSMTPVQSFTEKPAPAAARRMVARGTYLWNCGLFVWRASSILDALDRSAPALAREVRRGLPSGLAAVWRIPARSMRRIEALPVDRAVLERAGSLFVVRATFDWSDLGSWDAVASLLPADTHGNRSHGRIVAIESRDCENVNPGGITVLVGVRDLVVVRDREAVLVCPRGAAQRVREAHGRLRGRLSAHV